MSTEQVTCLENSAKNCSAKQQRFIRPQYQIESKRDRHVVSVVAPGASKDGVSVTREKDSLLITAQRAKHFQEDWRTIGREIVDADYRLRLRINTPVDDEGIEARIENGILEVTLPVAEEAKPRQIVVD